MRERIVTSNPDSPDIVDQRARRAPGCYPIGRLFSDGGCDRKLFGRATAIVAKGPAHEPATQDLQGIDALSRYRVQCPQRHASSCETVGECRLFRS